MSERNAALGRRWFQEVWNDRNLATVDELTPENLVGHHETQTSHSREDFKAMHGMILSLVPDVRAVVEEVLATESDIVVRWHFEGHTALDHSPITFFGMTWLKVADGKIVEGWDRWNPTSFVTAQRAAAA